MKFTQQPASGINLIRRYGPDFITLGDEDIRASCLVTAATLTRDWPPRTVEELKLEHLSPLFELAPEIVVLATDAQQKFPRAALRAETSAARRWRGLPHFQRTGGRGAAGAGGDSAVTRSGAREGIRVKAQGEKVV